jgi:hypothetical protein
MVAFLWFLLVLLVSRLALILTDRPLRRRQALGLALVQCAALLAAAPRPGLLPLFALIVAANLSGAWLERRSPHRAGGYRLAVLAVIVLGAGFTFAPAQAVAPSLLLVGLLDWLGRYSLFFAPFADGVAAPEVRVAMLVVIGAVLVMHEANLLIRLLLQLIRLVPHPRDGDAAADAPAQTELILPPLYAGAPPQRLDLREFNAGRFIGVLERLLAYAFVLQGQYAAIGLILAAKGFARFREMDQRDFAEYVLVGTLLSMTSAVLVAEGVKLLLP